MIAVGSGGMFGRGYLQGSQTNLDYVPEQHTDFIFTVVGEEFGFVGSVFVLALFALLLWRAIRIAYLSKDSFGTYLATGVASMFAIQIFVNVGHGDRHHADHGHPVAVPQLRGHGDARELHRGRDPARTCTCAGSSSARSGGRPTRSTGTSSPRGCSTPARRRRPSRWPTCRASVRPSPTPWWVRVLRSSACSSGSKMRSQRLRVDARAAVDHPDLRDPPCRS